MRLQHGLSRGENAHPLFSTWCGMIARCTNPKHENFRYYGARGIRVCDRWRHDFPTFLADMGERPSPKHSLDRIDPNGDYAPGNVRWATALQQVINRRPIPKVETCRHGHPFTPENTGIQKGRWRICRICQRACGAKYRKKRAETDAALMLADRAYLRALVREAQP